ncbi:UvrD-helicase domain-containing protein, partial [Bacillus licheniformis]|uniref:UvrD-helicase domain-containing protein n=1 Tax=Bacillus licheniformis TaxID=1402 RepID=UPI0022804586
HLRIIAGAGSGKTQTICAKAAYLNMMQNVPEKKIAMITFTNKAAEEMKNRVNEFTNNHKSEIQVATFNGMFRRLYNELKKEARQKVGEAHRSGFREGHLNMNIKKR